MFHEIGILVRREMDGVSVDLIGAVPEAVYQEVLVEGHIKGPAFKHSGAFIYHCKIVFRADGCSGMIREIKPALFFGNGHGNIRNPRALARRSGGLF